MRASGGFRGVNSEVFCSIFPCKLLIRKTKRRNALDDDDNDGRYETMRSITIISMQRVIHIVHAQKVVFLHRREYLCCCPFFS